MEMKIIRIQAGFSIWTLSVVVAAAYVLSVYLSK